MPELPEVETICCTLEKSILNLAIVDVIVRQVNLRYPIPHNLKSQLCFKKIQLITRRAKYLIFHIQIDQAAPDNCETLIIHLGMSGKLLFLPHDTPPFKHEHFVLIFQNGMTLRFIDPRRFGALLWLKGDFNLHPALRNLGVEPLTAAFNAHYLSGAVQRRQTTIKQLIMDNKIVVGVGNIYASEALFVSKILPQRKANTLSHQECSDLVVAIKRVLRSAIKCGGTTIRDFMSSDGQSGRFVSHLQVYGRAGEACYLCGHLLKELRLGQRNTFYCERCQR